MKKRFPLYLQATYDRRGDQIVLTAGNEHPALIRGGFRVNLKSGTQSETLLREAMIDAGVMSADGQGLGTQLEDIVPAKDLMLLRVLLDSGRNIIFTGLTGSGKTTLLSAALNYVNTSRGQQVLLYTGDPGDHDLNQSDSITVRGGAWRGEWHGTDAFRYAGRMLTIAKDEMDSRTVFYPQEHAVVPENTELVGLTQAMGTSASIYLVMHESSFSYETSVTEASERGFPIVVAIERETAEVRSLRIYVDGYRVNG